MPPSIFYDLDGKYTIGGRATAIEGMVGVKSGAVMGIVEDGNLPLKEITLVGELAEREAGHQLACVLPSSQGHVYGAIAQRKNQEPGLEGKYEGLVFLIDPATLNEAREFPIVGDITLKLKATSETENTRKAL